MRNASIVWAAAVAAAITVGNVSRATAEPAVRAAPPPPVAFEPPPELAKPTNPAATPVGAYRLTATFAGVDAATHKPWTYTSALIAVTHIESPRDSGTGQATGRRQYKPIKIVKPIDPTMPALFGGQLQTVVLHYVPVEPKAKVPTHTLTMTGLTVLGQQRQSGPPAHPDSANAEYLEIAFTYRKIEWTWNDGGKTSTDSWDAPL